MLWITMWEPPLCSHLVATFWNVALTPELVWAAMFLLLTFGVFVNFKDFIWCSGYEVCGCFACCKLVLILRWAFVFLCGGVGLHCFWVPFVFVLWGVVWGVLTVCKVMLEYLEEWLGIELLLAIWCTLAGLLAGYVLCCWVGFLYTVLDVVVIKLALCMVYAGCMQYMVWTVVVDCLGYFNDLWLGTYVGFRFTFNDCVALVFGDVSLCVAGLWVLSQRVIRCFYTLWRCYSFSIIWWLVNYVDNCLFNAQSCGFENLLFGTRLCVSYGSILIVPLTGFLQLLNSYLVFMSFNAFEITVYTNIYTIGYFGGIWFTRTLGACVIRIREDSFLGFICKLCHAFMFLLFLLLLRFAYLVCVKVYKMCFELLWDYLYGYVNKRGGRLFVVFAVCDLVSDGCLNWIDYAFYGMVSWWLRDIVGCVCYLDVMGGYYLFVCTYNLTRVITAEVVYVDALLGVCVFGLEFVIHWGFDICFLYWYDLMPRMLIVS
eukprot:gene3191-2173_t